MMNKPYTIQSLNTSINGEYWDNEKQEISLRRAIEAAEQMILSDEQLDLPDTFKYRVVKTTTDEVVWYN